MTKSVKKFIRKEKARIRAQFLDVQKQQEQIAELYKKIFSQPAVVAEPKKEESKINEKFKKDENKKDKTQRKNK